MGALSLARRTLTALICLLPAALFARSFAFTHEEWAAWHDEVRPWVRLAAFLTPLLGVRELQPSRLLLAVACWSWLAVLLAP